MKKHSKRGKIVQKKRKRGDNSQGAPHVTIERGLNLVPDRLRVVMDHTAILRMSAAATQCNYGFRPSSIYDVDPSIGGASCYGYAEYLPFYSSYRVYSSSIEIFASNLELEGANLFVLATPQNPGNNVADLSPYYAHPRARYLPLGPYTGNGSGRLSASCTTRAISGVTTLAADEYTSEFGTNPANNWFWTIGAIKTTNNFSYGIDMTVKIKITVDLFDRKVVQTGLAMLHRIPAGVSAYPPPIPVYMVPQPVVQPSTSTSNSLV